LPKIVDERLGIEVPLFAVGSLATAVFMCGAIAQFAVGRLSSASPCICCLRWSRCCNSAASSGLLRPQERCCSPPSRDHGGELCAVTVNDLVIARYTADAWRGRVYAVRYFSPSRSRRRRMGDRVSVRRGGFDLVLWSTVCVALGLVGACLVIAFLVNNVERAAWRFRRSKSRPCKVAERASFRSLVAPSFQPAFPLSTSAHASPTGASARR